MQDIERGAERAILVRLVTGLLTNVRANFFADMDFIAAVEVTIIGNHVFLAQCDGRPCTISDLARLTGLSRQSVRRRLEKLIASRYIEHRSRHYVLGPALARLSRDDRKLQQRITLVQDAARQLAKLAR